MQSLLLLVLLSDPGAYAPVTKHLDVKQCVALIDREIKSDCARFNEGHPDPESYRRRPDGPTCRQELHAAHERFCQWYGGTEVAEPCRKGFHAIDTASTTMDGLPTNRTICVRD